MQTTIRITYTALFEYPTHKEKISYQGKARYEKTKNSTEIDFYDKGIENKIKITPQAIWLQSGMSTLKLVSKKRIKNQYQTEYGQVYIDTILESCHTEGNIKIVYHLLEGNKPISKVYLLLQIHGAVDDEK